MPPIIVLYRGLGELPDYSVLRIPDGRIAQIYNINPGHNSRYSKAFEDLTEVTEVGRRALLQGKSVVEAARLAWDQYSEKLPHDMGGPFGLIDHIELIYDGLMEDLANSSPSGGGQAC